MSGTVYFLQVQPKGPIKIGFTTAHVNLRVRALQHGSPHELKWIGYFRATKKDEQAAHARFAEHRIRAEWFYPAQAVLDFVNEKCPVFDEAEYLRAIFQEDHRQLFKKIRHREWGPIVEKTGVSRYDLHKWASSDRILDAATAALVGDASRELLEGRR